MKKTMKKTKMAMWSDEEISNAVAKYNLKELDSFLRGCYPGMAVRGSETWSAMQVIKKQKKSMEEQLQRRKDDLNKLEANIIVRIRELIAKERIRIGEGG